MNETVKSVVGALVRAVTESEGVPPEVYNRVFDLRNMLNEQQDVEMLSGLAVELVALPPGLFPLASAIRRLEMAARTWGPLLPSAVLRWMQQVIDAAGGPDDQLRIMRNGLLWDRFKAELWIAAQGRPDAIGKFNPESPKAVQARETLDKMHSLEVFG